MTHPGSTFVCCNEPTVDYLISVIAMRFEQFDVASRLIAGILTSPTANPRMKDKARMIKEMIVKKIKERNSKGDLFLIEKYSHKQKVNQY